jgi:hypothetical protein
MEALQPTLPALEGRSPPPFVTASAEELRYARELKERLRELFPDRPTASVSLWSVGAD